MKSWKTHIVPLAFFTLLTIVYTFPLIINIGKLLPGPPEDNMAYLWNFWWVKKAVFQSALSPFFTHYLYYPTGVSLVYQDFTYFNLLLALPLSLVFNDAVAYNLPLILSYLFAALAMYALVWHLTEDKWAAVVAGTVFAFCPYHIEQFDHHLGLANIQFLPLVALMVIKQLQAPSSRNIFWGGLFITLASLSNWYYLVFSAVFAAFFVVYHYFIEKEQLIKAFPGLFLMFVMSATLLSPLLYPMLASKSIAAKGGFSAARCSSDLLGFFIPSLKHPLARWLGLEKIYRNFPCFIWEITVYLGYTVCFLGMYAWLKVKSPLVRFFGWAALFFLVLSLGPTLHFNGKTVLESVKLPYYWLIELIPFFKQVRTPARFTILSTMCISVLAGYAARDILSRQESPKMVGGLILLLIVIEHFAYPLKTSDLYQLTKADEIGRILVQDKEECAVLELPFTVNYIFGGMSMLRQTRHEKKILLGYIARIPDEAMSFIKQSPLNRLLTRPGQADTAYFERLAPFLKKNKIKYIILSRYLFGAQNQAYVNFVSQSLQNNFSWKREIGNSVTIYRVYD
ncbi:MAG: hypothetical protein ACE5GM_10835 [bacterium]